MVFIAGAQALAVTSVVVEGEVVGLVAAEEAIPAFHPGWHGCKDVSVGGSRSPGQWADDDQTVGGQPRLLKKPLKIRPFGLQKAAFSAGNRLEARVGIGQKIAKN